MGKSSKPQKGKKLNPADQKKLSDSIALWKTTYGDVLNSWNECTDEQKQAYLTNSPLLSELLTWSEGWK